MADIYYGKETEKAMNSFASARTPAELIRAYAEVKLAAIQAQQETQKYYPEDYYVILVSAIKDIIAGRYDSSFPLSLKQGGAGTSLHMNICEVISNLANSKFNGDYKSDPIENIAKFQSTNDTFPTAVTVVLYRKLEIIEKLVIELQEELIKRESTYNDIVITGRTEMQSALPIKLGQVFASWAGSIERDRWRLNKLKERIRTIALGGTAMGTCFSAPGKYVFKAEQNLRTITGLPLCRSQNLTDEVANQDKLSELASGFGLVAGNLFKIVSDLLIYTSSMTGEIKHPDLQYGSTIMAFKTNPVLLEYIKGLSINVKYDSIKIQSLCEQGQLQLNPMLPFILDAFFVLCDDLENAIKTFLEKLLPNLEINTERALKNLLESGALLNSLRPVISYNRIKELGEILKKHKVSDMDEFKKLVKDNTDLDADFIEKWFDPGRICGFTNN